MSGGFVAQVAVFSSPRSRLECERAGFFGSKDIDELNQPELP